MPCCELYYGTELEPKRWALRIIHHSQQNAPIIANPLIARGTAFAHFDDFGGNAVLEELVT